jgi:2-C-methyl-D-erythritol 4-phosphate cytidylyltransferase
MIHVSWGLILGCGKTEQLSNGVDVAFLNLGGKPVISYSIQAMEDCPEIDGISVVVRKERMAEVQRLCKLMGYTKVRRIVQGTTQRASSIKAGMASFDEDVSIAVIHESSRPNVSIPVITETVKAAKRYGCGVAGVRSIDPIKITPKGQKVTETADPNTVWNAQTPEAFKIDVLQKAIETTAKKKISLVDEACALEATKKDVHITPSSKWNMKITEPDDLAICEVLIRL